MSDDNKTRGRLSDWQAGVSAATASQAAALRSLPNATWTEVVPGVQFIQFSGANVPVTRNPGDVVGLPIPGQWRVRATPTVRLARTRSGELLTETLRGLTIGTVLRSRTNVIHLAWKIQEVLWAVTGRQDPMTSVELLELAHDWDVVSLVGLREEDT